jgi:hypothetical protein
MLRRIGCYVMNVSVCFVKECVVGCLELVHNGSVYKLSHYLSDEPKFIINVAMIVTEINILL